MEKMGETRWLFSWQTYCCCRGIVGHWVLEEVPQSLIYYTCVSFKSLSGPWGLLRRCTHYLQILALLVFHRMSTRPDPTVPSGIIESRVEFNPVGCSKNTWGKAPQPLAWLGKQNLKLMEVRGEIFFISDQRFAFVLLRDSTIWFTFLWLLQHQTLMSQFHYAAAELYLLVWWNWLFFDDSLEGDLHS